MWTEETGSAVASEDAILLAPEECVKERLDAFVARRLPDVTRSYAQKLIKDGCVLVNGKAERASFQVTDKDAVSVEMPEPEVLEAVPQNLPLDILYEDADVLVINKAAGMVTHPAKHTPDGTVVNAVLHHCPDLAGIKGTIRPGIVHRLDKDTSGVMVIAKNDRAQQALSAQIQDRSMCKEYVAIVHGTMGQPEGTICTNLARSRKDYKKVVVAAVGRPAVTHYELVEQFPDYAYLRLKLETGRTHQIRVHMQHIGHPVAGDPVYGPEKGRYAGKGQLLHARKLAFRHPSTGEEMAFEAPLPERFERVLAELEARREAPPAEED